MDHPPGRLPVRLPALRQRSAAIDNVRFMQAKTRWPDTGWYPASGMFRRVVTFAIRSIAASRLRLPKRTWPCASCSACCRGCAAMSCKRRGQAAQIHVFHVGHGSCVRRCLHVAEIAHLEFTGDQWHHDDRIIVDRSGRPAATGWYRRRLGSFSTFAPSGVSLKSAQ